MCNHLGLAKRTAPAHTSVQPPGSRTCCDIDACVSQCHFVCCVQTISMYHGLMQSVFKHDDNMKLLWDAMGNLAQVTQVDGEWPAHSFKVIIRFFSDESTKDHVSNTHMDTTMNMIGGLQYVYAL